MVALRAAKDDQSQDRALFAVQELLKVAGCSAETDSWFRAACTQLFAPLESDWLPKQLQKQQQKEALNRAKKKSSSKSSGTNSRGGAEERAEELDDTVMGDLRRLKALQEIARAPTAANIGTNSPQSEQEQAQMELQLDFEEVGRGRWVVLLFGLLFFLWFCVLCFGLLFF